MMSETFGANSMLDVAMCPVDACPPNLGLFNSVERPLLLTQKLSISIDKRVVTMTAAAKH